jgi:hypothetical protein
VVAYDGGPPLDPQAEARTSMIDRTGNRFISLPPECDEAMGRLRITVVEASLCGVNPLEIDAAEHL